MDFVSASDCILEKTQSQAGDRNFMSASSKTVQEDLERIGVGNLWWTGAKSMGEKTSCVVPAVKAGVWCVPLVAYSEEDLPER